jgi:hypothetical protein
MKMTEFWPFDRDAQDRYIANLMEKVTPYIVGKNVVNIRVSGARHILSRIDALETENERLRAFINTVADADFDDMAGDAITVGMVIQQQAKFMLSIPPNGLKHPRVSQ